MYLIGIGGPSCAGKTALARVLSGMLAAPVVALDSYYRDLTELPFDERARRNFDVPEALDSALLFEHLGKLARGEDAEVPVYDFAAHTRTTRTEHVRAAEFGIVEGLWTLYWEETRALLGTKVYVVAADVTCFERRMRRDVSERGRSRESVTEQYTATVRPMASAYILPTARHADVVVSGMGGIEQSAREVLAHVRAVRGGLPAGIRLEA